MKQTIQTNLGVDLSKKAIGKAMDEYKARFAEYSPRFDWTSEERGEFGFSAKGVKLGGTIVVRENAADVEMEVPFIFKIFQGRAMKVIEDQVNLWIDKAKRGELDD